MEPKQLAVKLAVKFLKFPREFDICRPIFFEAHFKIFDTNIKEEIQF